MAVRLPASATLFFTLGIVNLPLAAQRTVPADAGCMLHKDEYTCNWSSFALILERAHTISVGTEPMDRAAGSQLRRLIHEMGKVPANEDQPADLIFTVSPAPLHGVDFGPGDHDLARLRIYASSGSSPREPLVWAETYRGQGDRPWPAQVHALLSQFQDRLPRPH